MKQINEKNWHKHSQNNSIVIVSHWKKSSIQTKKNQNYSTCANRYGRLFISLFYFFAVIFCSFMFSFRNCSLFYFAVVPFASTWKAAVMRTFCGLEFFFPVFLSPDDEYFNNESYQSGGRNEMVSWNLWEIPWN